MIEKMTRQDMLKMGAAIVASNGYINDHDANWTGHENDLHQDMGAVVLLGNGQLAGWFGGGSCLNSLYIGEDDRLPHLSTWSVGGTIYRGSVFPDQESINEYNESVTSNGFKIIDYCVLNYDA